MENLQHHSQAVPAIPSKHPSHYTRGIFRGNKFSTKTMAHPDQVVILNMRPLTRRQETMGPNDVECIEDALRQILQPTVKQPYHTRQQGLLLIKSAAFFVTVVDAYGKYASYSSFIGGIFFDDMVGAGPMATRT